MLKAFKKEKMYVNCTSAFNADVQLTHRMFSSFCLLFAFLVISTECSFLIPQLFKSGNVSVLQLWIFIVVYIVALFIEVFMFMRVLSFFITRFRFRHQMVTLKKTKVVWGKLYSRLWAEPEGCLLENEREYNILWLAVPFSRRLIVEIIGEY